ncbi:hypothetical protein [Nocardioides halotolerans]|uniref:hypothetical protein n=1 Tax=Nocardioides halotolerans TaxID=433660 RepID=UPI0012F8BE32|nr:hypothetical protein [Nocardioides halotolerans]
MLKNRLLFGAVVVLCLGLVVTSVGWYRSSHQKVGDAQERRFDSCHIDGATAVLDYTYGVNEKVTLTTDNRGDDAIVVSFTAQQGQGTSIALGLPGQLRVAVGPEGGNGSSELTYPDGKKLTCKSN